MKKLYVLLSALALLSIASVAAAQDAQTPDEICAAALPASDPSTREYTEPGQVLDASLDYRAIFCTDAGAVYVDLLEDETPVTVNNFVFLAENDYYNNTTFHRVIPDFMAQAGDPTATGSGGPGYDFADEFLPSLGFDRPGLLAMANAGPATNGSQFFITTVPTPHLNQLHTIFGRVLSGQNNVLNIEVRDPASATGPGTSLQTVVIVTDPATVALPEVAQVTQEEVTAAMETVSSIVTPDIAETLESVTTTFTTQEVFDGLSDASSQALGDLLQEHDYQYRVTGMLNNKTCDLTNLQFISATYTLDAFASAAAAAAAIADGTIAQLADERGMGEPLTSENLSQPYYTQNITACDQDAVQALTYWQRGPFIATAEIVFPASDPSGVESVDQILSEFVGMRVFEPFLTDVLYRDIQ